MLSEVYKVSHTSYPVSTCTCMQLPPSPFLFKYRDIFRAGAKNGVQQNSFIYSDRWTTADNLYINQNFSVEEKNDVANVGSSPDVN